MFDQLVTLSKYISPDNISQILTIGAFLSSGFGYVLGKSNLFREVKARCWTGLLLIKVKFLRRPKYVYLYTDCEKSFSVTKGIADELKNQLKYHIEPVDNAEDLQWVPRHRSITRAIIVIITDVSPLSNNEGNRDKIQNELLEFAQSGGILILGHDALYRRAKNKKFAEEMKCELTIFERRDKKVDPVGTIGNSNGWVHYKKNPNIINSSLPDEFDFKDNEVVTCKTWKKQTKENQVIPIYTERDTGYILVAKRKYYDGCIFWINSGDHTVDAPPKSLRIQQGKFTIANLLSFLIENKDLELKTEDN